MPKVDVRLVKKAPVLVERAVEPRNSLINQGISLPALKTNEPKTDPFLKFSKLQNMRESLVVQTVTSVSRIEPLSTIADILIEGTDRFIPDEPDLDRFITALNTLQNRFSSKASSISTENISEVFGTLDDARRQFPKEVWKNTIKGLILQHPICRILHEDPCTLHSFSKPRGYPGDAELIDFLYRLNENYGSFTRMQRTVLDIITSRPSAVAVRERLRLAATKISEIIAQKPEAKIVALACGHLREIQHITKFTANQTARIIAIDQDPLSLNFLQINYPELNVTCINSNVAALLKGKHYAETANADFFYALGLFDYLSENLAQTTLQLMFSRLNHGGKLLVTNFTSRNPDIGYMETVMDWELIVRDSPDMYSLCKLLPENQVGEIRLYRGCNECIWYLEVTKNNT